MKQDISKWKKTDLGSVKKELGLPDSAECMGYVVHRLDTEEYLMDVVTKGDSISMRWVTMPDFARIYDDVRKAKSAADETEKNCIIGLLFDVGTYYQVGFCGD